MKPITIDIHDLRYNAILLALGETIPREDIKDIDFTIKQLQAIKDDCGKVIKQLENA